MLETSANPYAAELGDKATAASRLNLAQSFNGLGCILAPVIVGGFLFSGGSGGVEVPYTIMGVIVLVAALVFSRVSLPEISDSSETETRHSTADTGLAATIRDLWKRKTFRYGLLALFCYEVAEISINSFSSITPPQTAGWTKPRHRWFFRSAALGLFMVARVAGSAIMSRIKAEKVLLVCALMTVAGAVAVTLDLGVISRGGVFICYAFEAIMFLQFSQSPSGMRGRM